MKKILLPLFLMCLSLGAAEMQLISGDYRVDFRDNPDKWSIIRIFWKSAEMGTPTGYYNNVFSPVRGGYIGAGHTQGGEEKLLSVKLTVDGEEKPLGEAVYKAKNIVLVKESMLDKLKMSVTYTLTEKGLYISKYFTVTAEQPAYQLYIYQFCWNKDTTDFVWFGFDGDAHTGKLKSDDKMRTNKEAIAMAQFLPEKKAGIYHYRVNPRDYRCLNMLWDKKNYHKYYAWMILPEKLSAGLVSPKIDMVVRGFDAINSEDFVTMAEDVHKEALKEFPPDKYPEEVAPLRGVEVKLPASDKFQVRKFAVNLQPGGSYVVTFQIRKTPKMSKTPSDHYLLLGYNLPDGSYKAVKNMGDDIKADGEFHTVTANVTMPGGAKDFSICVYNSRSTGELTLKDLTFKLVKQK